MCSISVTPRNKSCQLTWKNVKEELRELKIDIQLYELVLPIMELRIF